MIFWVALATVILGVTGAIFAYYYTAEMTRNQTIRDGIAKGVDPVATRCAVNAPSTMAELALCLKK